MCPEESLRGFEEEEIFLADVIAACEKSGLAAAPQEGKSENVYNLFLVAVQAVGRRDHAEEAIHFPVNSGAEEQGVGRSGRTIVAESE